MTTRPSYDNAASHQMFGQINCESSQAEKQYKPPKRVYPDLTGSVPHYGGPLQGSGQSYIATAMQQVDNQVEHCLSQMDQLTCRLSAVSRNLVREETNQIKSEREGDSELAHRLHHVMNGLVELDRRIVLQLDALEI